MFYFEKCFLLQIVPSQYFFDYYCIPSMWITIIHAKLAEFTFAKGFKHFWASL